MGPLPFSTGTTAYRKGPVPKAFLNVPLYKSLFDKYSGGVIPPAAALERDITGLGVAEKQTSRARQVFERSADQAGYFEYGKNRLVMPGVASRAADSAPPAPAEEETPARDKKKGGGGGGDGLDDVHHFIRGLLATLPAPETDWPSASRVKWLQTAANIFDLICTGDGGGISVTAARAERSPRPGDHWFAGACK